MNKVFVWPSRHAADGTKKQARMETEQKGSCPHGKLLGACGGRKRLQVQLLQYRHLNDSVLTNYYFQSSVW